MISLIGIWTSSASIFEMIRSFFFRISINKCGFEDFYKILSSSGYKCLDIEIAFFLLNISEFPQKLQLES